jgi:DNA-binding NarL/FixJ family response regulator
MRGKGVLADRLDWIRLPEAAYAYARNDEAWMEAITEGFQSAVVGASAVGMHVISHDPDFANAVKIEKAFPAAWLEMKTDDLVVMRGEIARAIYYPPFTVGTHGDLMPMLNEETREALLGWRRNNGVGDCMAMLMHPSPNMVLLLFAFYERALPIMSPRERRVLTQIALHIESGYRLRHRPEMVRAELTADGKVLDSIFPADDEGSGLGLGLGNPTPTAVTNAMLETHAARIKRARSKQERMNPGSLDLWTSLIEGRVTLTPRDSGSERRYVVLENPIATHPLRALTQGERDVITLAARGLSTKLTAYALGISSATVSSRLGSIARKLGLASRTELVRIAAMLARDPRAALPTNELTAAEQDILDLLRLGLSNQAIAERRARSVRTIANQVASLLRKTGSTSRRQLVARLH